MHGRCALMHGIFHPVVMAAFRDIEPSIEHADGVDTTKSRGGDVRLWRGLARSPGDRM